MIDKLEIEVALQIRKPVSEVFEAIINPDKMSNYFILKSSGRMQEGEEIKWWFPEFEEEFLIRVNRVEQDRYISYYWDIDEEELLVEITLTPKEDSTLVSITEKSKDNNESGIRWLKSNTAGWANFLDCLKAYLEFGVNLRKGSYDFLKKIT